MIGEPCDPCRSHVAFAVDLQEHLSTGHGIDANDILSARTGRLLRADGYSLQSNRKTKEGGDHPDRNAIRAHHATP